MRSMALSVLFTLCMSVLASSRVAAQTQPTASAGSLPLSVGAGLSDYNVDWGSGRMLGGTLWVDLQPPKLPDWLQGLGAEIEARDISLNRSSSQPPNLRQDTLGGGPMYTVNHYHAFHPYVKFVVSYGSTDFKSFTPNYSHDTRTVYAPGGGIEFALYQHLWARADYEYQYWPKLQAENPQGFTVGVMYRFRDFGGR
jgi:opacity protein-like surface antigen